MIAELVTIPLFRGDRVCLVRDDPETLGKSLSQWERDSLYRRLLSSSPPKMYSSAAQKEFIEKDEDDPTFFTFSIRGLEDDRLVGFIELDAIDWSNGDGWVGIGIGLREDWGKGYGSDALRLLLRFAFYELNLHRVSLGVFSHNQRAIRAYEKAGFQIEGRERRSVLREGERTDDIVMGLLRSEWLEMEGE